MYIYIYIYIPSFTTKSSCKSSGQPSLEIFLCKIEKEIIAILHSRLGCSNLDREEWQAICDSLRPIQP